MTVVTDDYDTPWKDILEAYFPQFLMFFFPLVYANIDWSKGYKFLDKELQKIVRDAKTGRRYADKLVEVISLEGKKIAIIIHIEIQGDRESAFPERMYIYNYRFYDRYRLPVVSLALLTDDDPSWRPGKFGYEKWGCKVELEFPMVKMLDYTDNLPELEAETNPFAIIVLAHLGTQKTKHDLQNRYKWKWKIIRLLYDRG